MIFLREPQIGIRHSVRVMVARGGCFDVIVVGAGSSGCALVHSLLGRRRQRGGGGGGGKQLLPKVLLIDQGHEHTHTTRAEADPSRWPELLGDGCASRCDTCGVASIAEVHTTEPQPGLGGRQVWCPAGRGPGGSSRVNATIYSRAPPSDFDDHWPHGWKSCDVEASFNAVECKLRPSWQPATGIGKALARATASANVDCGCGKNIDGGGEWSRLPRTQACSFRDGKHILEIDGGLPVTAQSPACGYSPGSFATTSSSAGGARVTAFDVFVRPLMRGSGAIDDDGGTAPLLTVECGAAVQRVVMDGLNAVGVCYSKCCSEQAAVEERTAHLAPGGEVVLCCGAFETPKILMLSGIGDAEALRSLGIEPLANVPAVGRALCDHVVLPLMCLALRPLTKSARCRNSVQCVQVFRRRRWQKNQQRPRQEQAAEPKTANEIARRARAFDTSRMPCRKAKDAPSCTKMSDKGAADAACANSATLWRIAMLFFSSAVVHCWGAHMIGRGWAQSALECSAYGACVLFTVRRLLTWPSSGNGDANDDWRDKIQLQLLDGEVAPLLAPSLVSAPFRRGEACRRAAGSSKRLRFVGFAVDTLHWLVLRVLQLATRCPPVCWIFRSSFGINVCLVCPGSRGTVRLRSSNPRDPPVVDPGFLGAPADVDAIVEGFRYARRAIGDAMLRTFVPFELFPGPFYLYACTNALERRYVRDFATTFYHACGTCAMSSEESEGVVDGELRVLGGVTGLRVADASVFPHPPSVPTAATAMMVGHRAGQLILPSAGN